MAKAPNYFSLSKRDKIDALETAASKLGRKRLQLTIELVLPCVCVRLDYIQDIKHKDNEMTTYRLYSTTNPDGGMDVSSYEQALYHSLADVDDALQYYDDMLISMINRVDKTAIKNLWDVEDVLNETLEAHKISPLEIMKTPDYWINGVGYHWRKIDD